MFSDESIRQYLEGVASGEPVPGGGSVCALAAAAGAALTAMVAGLTIGREKYAAAQTEIVAIEQRAGALQAQLLDDVDRDAEAYRQVMAAYRLPKTTGDERIKRRRAIESAFKTAARVPLAVAGHAIDILDLADRAIAVGNPNASTDGLVGAAMARSAALGAVFNVQVNLQSIEDEGFVQRVGRQAETLESQAKEKEENIFKRRNVP